MSSDGRQTPEQTPEQTPVSGVAGATPGAPEPEALPASVLEDDLLLGVTSGLAAAREVEPLLAGLVEDASATHRRLLQGVRAFSRAWAEHCEDIGVDPEGGSSTTAAALATVLRSTEHQAHRLLRHSELVHLLDDGVGLLDEWTVEQLGKVLDEVGPLARTDLALADEVIADARGLGRQVGTARLVRRVRATIARLTGEKAADRRRRADAQRRVELFPLPDGQAELHVIGPAVAVHRMARVIRAHAEHPVMQPLRVLDEHDQLVDDRSPDNVRFDALLDLLTGRGCGQHTAPPPTLLITVPVQTALDRVDEPAALDGAQALDGPVDAAAARDLLLSGRCSLRAVPVDARTGVPLDAPGRPVQPRTPTDTRAALLQMLHDARRHPPDPSSLDPQPSPQAGGTASTPYRVPGRLRRFVQVRSPRCEWPGCSRPAARCDTDHDVAWPLGPTAGHNLGPLCRHHHRLKQTGWAKARDPVSRDTAVRWTGPTGTRLTVVTDHRPPVRPTRPLAPLLDQGDATDPVPAHLRRYDPVLDGDLDEGPPPAWSRSPADDPAPDRFDALMTDPWHDTTWTVDLDDPTRDLPHPADAA
jgi:hypothetical protein